MEEAAPLPPGYKKKVKPGLIELDSTEPTIVVHYDETILDTTNLGPNGEPTIVQRKPGARRMKLKTFKETSDITKFTNEIISKCNYIHPSKAPHVEGLLMQLRQRLIDQRTQQQPETGYSDNAAYAQQLATQQAITADAQFQQQQQQQWQQQQPQQQQQQQQWQQQQLLEQQQQQLMQFQQQQQMLEQQRLQAQQQQFLLEQQRVKQQLQLEEQRLREQQEQLRLEQQRIQEIQQQQIQLEQQRQLQQQQQQQQETAARQKPTPVQVQAAATSKQSNLAPPEQSNSSKSATSKPSPSASGNRTPGGSNKIVSTGTTTIFSMDALDDEAEPQFAAASSNKPRSSDKKKRSTATTEPTADFAASARESKVLEQKSFASSSESQEDLDGSRGGATRAVGGGSKGKIKARKFVPPPSSFKKTLKEEKPKRKKLPKASIEKIEAYLEKLYEDVEEKIWGTGMLLQLARDPENLQYFVNHNTIINTLSRVLTEDRKKSTELVTNILEIFFCFSAFTQLHHILLQNKIGDTTLRIVELEMKRYELWQSQGTAGNLTRQERLLFVCLYILLNLSENADIEKKITTRHINEHLVRMLQRENPDDRKFLDEELEPLVLLFLRRLSIVRENKDEMAESDVIAQLVPYLLRTDATVPLREKALRLLYNLSFDPDLRREITEANLIPTLVEAVHVEGTREWALKILYNISEEQEEELLNIPDLATLVNKLLITSRDKFLNQDLIALAINLSTHMAIAEIMCPNESAVLQLLRRVHQTFDPLLMKYIRNISEHPSLQRMFERHLHELVGMIMKSPTPDFLVESLGVLGNLCLPEALYSQLIVQHGFLEFLMKHLIAGVSEDDIVLEVVIVIGTLAIDPASAPLLANMRLVRLLFDVLNDKQDDDEIVCQTVYTLFKLLLHPVSREVVIRHENLANAMLHFVASPHPDTRRFAHMSLDIIVEADEKWRAKILEKRFEAWNPEFLQFCQAHGGDHDEAIPTGGAYVGRDGDVMYYDSGHDVSQYQDDTADLSADYH